jgi:hypothetical protein
MSTRMIRRAATLGVIVGCLSSQPCYANNGSIGVYFDPDGTTCSGTATVGVPLTLYVNANLAGATGDGIISAEFRVAGMPAGWFITVTPSPGSNVALGNLFTGGCAISFPECESSAQHRVNLYSVWVGPTYTPSSETRLVVVEPQRPSQWNYITLQTCNAPVYTTYIVPGGTAILNGSACTVGVAPTTWSALKGLYGVQR